MTRFEQVRQEWLEITHLSPIDALRFEEVKHEADALVVAGLWTSGPGDMLSILGRQRDELAHSRLIAWLMVPTNRHGLGRAVLTAFLDAIWPGEALMRSGPVVVDLEVPGSGIDENGRMREARADIVLRGDGVTVVIENKVDAGEQHEQCARLYWSWAGEPGEVRWVFLTPSGRAPLTTAADPVKSAWCTMSYREFHAVVAGAIAGATPNSSIGRATAIQYLETLTRSVARA